MLVGLSIPVMLRRRAARVGLGAGEDKMLLARMRAQANFAEYTPFILVMLGLAENQGGRVWWLALLGGGFLIGRVLHAYALWYGVMRFRVVSMTMTWAILVLLAITLMVQVFTS
jgi:uncharacterized membrane protein YecN with MAPEG domain